MKLFFQEEFEQIKSKRFIGRPLKRKGVELLLLYWMTLKITRKETSGLLSE